MKSNFVTRVIKIFTDTKKGIVPASGGGTENFLRADGSWATTGLKTKSGTVSGATFTGTPKKVTITFSSAFADANYSVSIIGTTAQRSWTVESRLASSFVINSNSGASVGGNVLWQAIKHGES